MGDTKVTAEELVELWSGDIRQMAEAAATAMNTARAGSIIADSEEPFRDASAEFRCGAYEKLVGLLQAKQEAFSPSAQRAPVEGASAGDAPDDQRSNDD